MVLNLILFILCGVSITNLIVNATILDFLRDFLISLPSKFQRIFRFRNKNICAKIEGFLKSLLECMMCSGFWIGLMLSVFFGINPIVGALIISLLGDFYSKSSDVLNSVYDYCVANVEEKDEERGESD